MEARVRRLESRRHRTGVVLHSAFRWFLFFIYFFIFCSLLLFVPPLWHWREEMPLSKRHLNFKWRPLCSNRRPPLPTDRVQQWKPGEGGTPWRSKKKKEKKKKNTIDPCKYPMIRSVNSTDRSPSSMNARLSYTRQQQKNDETIARVRQLVRTAKASILPLDRVNVL